MAERTYIISSDPGSSEPLSVLAQRLRDAGVVVTQQLDAAGVIVGRAGSAAAATLRAIPGVGAVEEERDVHVPPVGGDDG